MGRIGMTQWRLYNDCYRIDVAKFCLEWKKYAVVFFFGGAGGTFSSLYSSVLKIEFMVLEGRLCVNPVSMTSKASKCAKKKTRNGHCRPTSSALLFLAPHLHTKIYIFVVCFV